METKLIHLVMCEVHYMKCSLVLGALMGHMKDRQKCIFRKCIFQKFCKFLAGSFSAVSKRKFARKYAFDSVFQDLQDVHAFAPLQTQHFSKK